MAYNRTVSFNTNSLDIEKAVNSLLFYINICKERILQDSEYLTNPEVMMPLDEARALLSGMFNLCTYADSEFMPEDGNFLLETVFAQTKDIVIPS